MLQRALVVVGLAALTLSGGQTVSGQTASHYVPAHYVTEMLAARYLAVADSAFAAPKDRAAWQKRLDASRDTIENVLAWQISRGHGDDALRLLIPLGRFWNGPSFVSSFETALALSGTDPAIRARALNTASAAAFRIKDQQRTRQWANESIVIWRSLGNSAQTGRAYERLVQAALRDGDHTALRALADTGDALCAQANDDDCRAYFLNMRGESERVLKRYASAAMFYDQSAAIYIRISPVVRLDIIHNSGFALLGSGNYKKSCVRFREGLSAAVAVGDRRYYGAMLSGLASCDAMNGNPAGAAKLFGVSDAQFAQIGIVPDPADAVEYERYRAIARTQLGRPAFDSAVRIGRALPVDSVINALK